MWSCCSRQRSPHDRIRVRAFVTIEIGAKNEVLDPVYPLPCLPSWSKPLSYRKLPNETMAGVNSRFAEVTENDILPMKDITIPNDTRKATRLVMKVLRDKQCFNTQFAHMSSVFCPDRQASLMALSLNNNCPSTLQFKVLSKSTQLPLSKTSPFNKI